MLNTDDLDETVAFKDYKNFSIGIQMVPTAFNYFPINSNYSEDCSIINKLT
jgi:hypothetical protein